MSDPRTEHALHLALLALQTGLIDRARFEAVLDAWNADRTRDMASLLADHGQLPPETLALLTALAARHASDLGTPTAALTALAANAGSSTVEEIVTRVPELTDTFVTQTPSGDETQVSFGAGTNGPGSRDSGAPGAVRYRRVDFHAKGGLGAVYVAVDEELNRNVALKEIQSHLAHNASNRERFLREAEITGRLEHPGIVPVYGLGSYADGRPFYAMRFIHGESLEAACNAFHADPNPDPSARSIALRGLLRRFLDVCNAVEYAHSRGVLHRDLKPGNIMVGKYGETLVVDWGLARAMGKPESSDSDHHAPPIDPSTLSGSVQTIAGHTLGTPGYMSPEQADGLYDQLGPASDVYSLGATLYFILTGKGPFSGIPSLAELNERRRNGEFPSPRTVNPETPLALDAICRKAMSPKPEDRYSSPRALADDVEHYLADRPTAARPDGPAERILRWTRHHKAATITAFLLPLLIGSLVAVLLVEAARRQTDTALTAAKAEKEKTTAALHREEAAQRETKEALQAAEAAKSQTARALQEVEAAQRKTKAALLRENTAKQLAEANFDKARQVVDDYLTTIGEDEELKATSRNRGLRRKLIEKARTYYEPFLKNRVDDPQLMAAIARAQIRMADTYRQLGEVRQAIPLYKESSYTLRKLLSQDAISDANLLELGNVLNALSRSDQLEPWVFPDSKRSRAILDDLRSLPAGGKALPDFRGSSAYRDGCPADVATIAIFYHLTVRNPSSFHYQFRLAVAIGNYGALNYGRIRPRDLHALTEYGLAVCSRVCEGLPQSTNALALRSILCFNLQFNARSEGDLSKARDYLRQECDSRRRLVALDPTSIHYKANFIDCLSRLYEQGDPTKDTDTESILRDLIAQVEAAYEQTVTETYPIYESILPLHRLALLYRRTGKLSDSLNLSLKCAALCRAGGYARLHLIASLKNITEIQKELGVLDRGQFASFELERILYPTRYILSYTYNLPSPMAWTREMEPSRGSIMGSTGADLVGDIPVMFGD